MCCSIFAGVVSCVFATWGLLKFGHWRTERCTLAENAARYIVDTVNKLVSDRNVAVTVQQVLCQNPEAINMFLLSVLVISGLLICGIFMVIAGYSKLKKSRKQLPLFSIQKSEALISLWLIMNGLFLAGYIYVALQLADEHSVRGFLMLGMGEFCD